MKKCSVCGAPIGDTDLTCPTCRAKNVDYDKPDLAFYPFMKSNLASATSEDLGVMVIADLIFVAAIIIIALIF